MNIQPIFEPYTLNNGVTVDNRLVVAPMTHWASDAEGHLTGVERAFLNGRAKDFGLFITAATLVSPEGKAFAGEPDANDIDRAWATGTTEFLAFGKAVLVNPNLVELLRSGRYDEIETELDSSQPERYHFPPILWQYSLQGSDILPRVKK